MTATVRHVVHAHAGRVRPILIAVAGGVAAVASFACGATGSGPRRADCLVAAEDSVFLRGGPVYRECAVQRKARLMTAKGPIDYTPPMPTTLGKAVCSSAQVRFVVDATGMPELATARVTKTTDTGHGEALLAAVRGWRYEPALKDGQPVRQIVDERDSKAIAVTSTRAGQASSPPRVPSACR